MQFLDKLKERRKKRETVQEIHVDIKRPKLRLLIVIGLIAVGLAGIGLGVSYLVNKDNGWRTIEMSPRHPEAEDGIVLNYCLGKSGMNATAEYKEISALYADIGYRAYKVFHAREMFDGVNNLCSLSSNVNSQIEVDPLLYDALDVLAKEDNRLIYFAPIYAELTSLCNSGGDEYAALKDPLEDGETAEFFKKVRDFATDPEMINIDLLGDNRVRLFVSEEYLSFASEHEITCFLDLYWLKNAFVIDAVADEMIDNGYKNGNINSFDGFSRNLDDSDDEYRLNFFNLRSDVIYPAASVSYKGSASFVSFRAYPMSEKDRFCYYTYTDGKTVTPYVLPENGLYTSGMGELTVSSKNIGCGELAVKAYGAFCKGDEIGLSDLLREDIVSVWCENDTVFYNGNAFSAVVPYSDDDVAYATEKK